MELKFIRFELRDNLAWIIFNRPEKLNAINPVVLSDLETVLAECEKDSSIRVVLLKGNEKVFIAGADIEHMATGDINLAYELTDQTLRVQERLADLPKPTIAVISGYALGGGCEIALCCDFRIASENALFGFPEIKLGIIPGEGEPSGFPALSV